MALTERESQSDRPVGVSANVVVCIIAAIIMFAISAVTYLIVVGREVDSVVALLTVIAVPSIASLFTLVKVDRQDSKVDTIKRNTNGMFEKMEARMAALEQNASTNTPDTDTVAFPTVNPNPDTYGGHALTEQDPRYGR